MGWSATADAVDNWIYEDTNSTFIKDEEMRNRLLNLNPHSFRKVVSTLLEVNGRGYWETSEENLDLLRQKLGAALPDTASGALQGLGQLAAAGGSG